jgi:hypothetical protein
MRLPDFGAPGSGLDGTIPLGIVDRSHHSAENGESVLRGFELVKTQGGFVTKSEQIVKPESSVLALNSPTLYTPSGPAV